MKKIKVILFSLLLVMVPMLSSCGNDKTNKFSVIFRDGEEIYSIFETAGNEEVSLPENPTKENYIFDGWYFDEDVWQNQLNKESYNDDKLEENVSVYAKWKPQEFSIIYHYDGGEETNTVSKYNVESEDIQLNETSKNKFRFDGWFTEDTFENKITNIESGSARNLDLYAKFTPTTITSADLESYIETLFSNKGVENIESYFGTFECEEESSYFDEVSTGYSHCSNWKDSKCDEFLTSETIDGEEVQSYFDGKYLYEFNKTSGEYIVFKEKTEGVFAKHPIQLEKPDNPSQEGQIVDQHPFNTMKGTYETITIFLTNIERLSNSQDIDKTFTQNGYKVVFETGAGKYWKFLAEIGLEEEYSEEDYVELDKATYTLEIEFENDEINRVKATITGETPMLGAVEIKKVSKTIETPEWLDDCAISTEELSNLIKAEFEEKETTDIAEYMGDFHFVVDDERRTDMFDGYYYDYVVGYDRAGNQTLEISGAVVDIEGKDDGNTIISNSYFDGESVYVKKYSSTSNTIPITYEKYGVEPGMFEIGVPLISLNAGNLNNILYNLSSYSNADVLFKEEIENGFRIYVDIAIKDPSLISDEAQVVIEIVNGEITLIEYKSRQKTHAELFINLTYWTTFKFEKVTEPMETPEWFNENDYV